MATIDEDLGQLERDIRQLKIEYDQYFGGGRKRPPTEIEWRIESTIKRYGERGGDLKYGQRFRLNNLTQTYSKYKDIFRKKTQQKEEGSVQRHFGAAAKAIEAERAQKRPKTQPQDQPPTPLEAPAPAAAGAFRVTCSEPERESEKVDQLYQAFVQAKQQAGEQTAKLSRSSFNEFVLKKTKDLQKQKKCRDVEYVVEVVDGQVKLKALVKA
ncbi:MAG: MXAN_5187 C-terminal domain-containing protein [Candidatus Acidiferrum sp.]